MKSEVENCLKEKRENDPYRSILGRQVYQAIHGPESVVPTVIIFFTNGELNSIIPFHIYSHKPSVIKLTI